MHEAAAYVGSQEGLMYTALPLQNTFAPLEYSSNILVPP